MRAARRRIAGRAGGRYRQRGPPQAVRGRGTQEFLDAARLAIGALRLFAAADQKLEITGTLFATVFKNRHGDCGTSESKYFHLFLNRRAGCPASATSKTDDSHGDLSSHLPADAESWNMEPSRIKRGGPAGPSNLGDPKEISGCIALLFAAWSSRPSSWPA